MGFHAMTDTPIFLAFIKSPNLCNVFMYDQIWIFNGSLGCQQNFFVYFQPVSVQFLVKKMPQQILNRTYQVSFFQHNTWTKSGREYYVPVYLTTNLR